MNSRLIILFLTLSTLSLTAQNLQNLPFFAPTSFTGDLRSQQDNSLQNRLEQKLRANRKWKLLIANKKLAVGLVDLSDPLEARFASVNGKEMMYAASLPKIAILLAAMDAIDKGELNETPAVREDMRIMISKSNNQASTRMIDRVGYDKIAEVLTNPNYQLYDKKYGGGLWVGKRYAASGARNPDPLKGLSHAATVEQVCRFYYLLAKGELVNHKRSKQMLDYMENPELHHKFVNTLEKVAPDARLFRKSGSWRTYHSDSVLVWGPNGRKYILVALANDSEGEQIMRQLVKTVENVLAEEGTILAIN